MSYVNQDLFGISKDHKEKSLQLDPILIPNPESTYLFELSGDALAPYALSGDRLVVDRSISVSNGSLVVCEYAGEIYCRIYYREKNQVVLKAINSKSASIILKDEASLYLHGVVKWCLRQVKGF